MLLERLAGKKILVTGARGFIGSHLCTRLLGTGAQVHAVSRRQARGEQNGLQWLQADLAVPESVGRILADVRPELIFHLAGHVVGARDLECVMPTFLSNLVSTVNLLTLAAEVGCQRMILTGSMEEPEQGNPLAVPSSPYAVAKWASGAYGRMFHALYKLPVTILRVFMVYGPAQQDLRKLVPFVTLSLLKGEAPKLSSGRRAVDWVYVGDVVEGYLAAATAADVEGKTIDIGSGELVPVRSVVEHLVRLINPRIQPLFGAIPERPMEQERLADTATSLKLIGWRPLTSLEDGLRKTVDWYAGLLREGQLNT